MQITLLHSLSIINGCTISCILKLINEELPKIKTKHDVSIDRLSKFQPRAMNIMNNEKKIIFSDAVNVSLNIISLI